MAQNALVDLLGIGENAPPRRALPAGLDPETDAIVRTVYGEAANQKPEGRRAVAAVILNRARLSGKSPTQVVLDEGQFEPWSDAKARKRMEELDPEGDDYKAVLTDISDVLNGQDPTGGATHFYAPKTQAELGRPKPEWDDGTGVDIGDHRFFVKDIEGRSAPTLLDILGIAPQAGATATETPGAIEITVDRSTNPEFLAAQAAKEASQKDLGGAGLQKGIMDALGLAGNIGQRGLEVVEAMGGLNPMLAAAAKPFLNTERQDAFRQSAMSGLALGGKNEIISGAGALGARMRGQDLTGAFDDNLSTMDARDRALREAYPGTYTGGAVLGALSGGMAVPAMTGGSLMARMGVGAASGGVQGGVGGYLGTDGTQADRLRGAAVGTILGGAGGAILGPLAGRGPNPQVVQQLAEAGISGTGAPVSRAEATTANAILRALQRDETAPATVLATSRETGMLPFAAGGENLAGLAEVAAQTPGNARTVLGEAIGAREAKAVDRIKNNIGEAIGGRGDYFAALDALASKRSNDARNGMAKIANDLMELDHNSILALRSDLAKGALKEAAQNAAASTDETARLSAARLNGLAEVALDDPSAARMSVRDVQDVTFALKEAASAAYQSGNGARGKALKTLADSIRDNARSKSPSYAKWLKDYGDESDNIAALELGFDILSNSKKVSDETFSKAFDKMSEPARDYFRKGVAEALLQKVRSGQGGVNAMRQLLRSEDVSNRVRIAFPDEEAYQGFMEAARREVLEANRNNRVLANSRTSFRDEARADLKAEPGLDPLEALSVMGEIGTGNGPALVKRMLKSIPKADRNVLTDPAANAALGRALSDPEALATLLQGAVESNRVAARNAGSRLGAAGAGAGRGAAALSALLQSKD